MSQFLGVEIHLDCIFELVANCNTLSSPLNFLSCLALSLFLVRHLSPPLYPSPSPLSLLPPSSPSLPCHPQTATLDALLSASTSLAFRRSVFGNATATQLKHALRHAGAAQHFAPPIVHMPLVAAPVGASSSSKAGNSCRHCGVKVRELRYVCRVQDEYSLCAKWYGPFSLSHSLLSVSLCALSCPLLGHQHPIDPIKIELFCVLISSCILIHNCLTFLQTFPFLYFSLSAFLSPRSFASGCYPSLLCSADFVRLGPEMLALSADATAEGGYAVASAEPSTGGAAVDPEQWYAARCCNCFSHFICLFMIY
jgi:hypothetical protein